MWGKDMSSSGGGRAMSPTCCPVAMQIQSHLSPCPAAHFLLYILQVSNLQPSSCRSHLWHSSKRFGDGQNPDFPVAMCREQRIPGLISRALGPPSFMLNHNCHWSCIPAEPWEVPPISQPDGAKSRSCGLQLVLRSRPCFHR